MARPKSAAVPRGSPQAEVQVKQSHEVHRKSRYRYSGTAVSRGSRQAKVQVHRYNGPKRFTEGKIHVHRYTGTAVPRGSPQARYRYTCTGYMVRVKGV